MKKIKFTLVVLAFCILLPTMSAAKDYSYMEKAAETILLDPNNNLAIASADVTINTQQVTINCVNQITKADELFSFLGGIVDVYSGIVSNLPEVGDLLIISRNIDKPDGVTYTCQKSWLNDVPENERVMSVFLTAKED